MLMFPKCVQMFPGCEHVGELSLPLRLGNNSVKVCLTGRAQTIDIANEVSASSPGRFHRRYNLDLIDFVQELGDRPHRVISQPNLVTNLVTVHVFNFSLSFCFCSYSTPGMLPGCCLVVTSLLQEAERYVLDVFREEVNHE